MPLCCRSPSPTYAIKFLLLFLLLTQHLLGPVGAKLLSLGRLLRHFERSGEHGRLDWSEIETALLPTQMTLPSADLDELLTSLPWEGGLGYNFRNLAYINIQECVAVLDELDRQIHSGVRSCRYVIATDSRVCVGAISKGRSSSRSLNAVLRKLATTCVAMNIELVVVWMLTKANPADAVPQRAAGSLDGAPSLEPAALVAGASP